MWSYWLYNYLVWWPPSQELESALGGVTIYIYIYIFFYVHIYIYIYLCTYIFNISPLFWWRSHPTPLWGPGSVNHDWNMFYLYQCLGRSNLTSSCFKWIESTNGPTFSGFQKNKNNIREQTHHWKNKNKTNGKSCFCKFKTHFGEPHQQRGPPFFSVLFLFFGGGAENVYFVVSLKINRQKRYPKKRNNKQIKRHPPFLLLFFCCFCCSVTLLFCFSNPTALNRCSSDNIHIVEMTPKKKQGAFPTDISWNIAILWGVGD